MTLSLAGVGYRYAGATRPSLLDVDLDLPDGTVIGVVGPSESGKTTLCLVTSGLAPRTVGGQIRGRITLDGEDVDGWPMHRHRLPEPIDADVAGGRDRLRGGRLRSDEPGRPA